MWRITYMDLVSLGVWVTYTDLVSLGVLPLLGQLITHEA